MPPEISYAKTADGVHVAYTVLGEGPPLLVAPTLTQCIEWSFEDPACFRFIDHLAGFARVIVFDRRGTGHSDPMLGAPTLEERAEDITAVLDATLVDRAVLLGVSEGGAMCALFAATRPERTAALITWGTLVRSVADEGDTDDPYFVNREIADRWAERPETEWGSGLDFWNPSVMHDPAHQRTTVRRMQLGASPAMAKALNLVAAETDLRSILPEIRVPTLVLHRTGDLMPIANGRYIASKIAEARFVELPGNDHYPWIGDMESAISEIQGFVTGVRPSTSYDRVLSAVLFTDLVASTDHASEVGDVRWRDTLVQHERIVRDQINRHRGRFVRSTGDGALGLFDGPSRAVRCARSIVDEVRALGLDARAGVHAGEVELISEDIGGIAVHIAQRVMSEAGPREVFATSTVKDLSVGSGIVFEDLGDYELKGVSDRWRLYRAKVR